MRCENKSMRHRLYLRLKALEKWLPDETKPHKALLPEWLVDDLRQQGIRFDAFDPLRHGRQRNTYAECAEAT